MKTNKLSLLIGFFVVGCATSSMGPAGNNGDDLRKDGTAVQCPNGSYKFDSITDAEFQCSNCQISYCEYQKTGTKHGPAYIYNNRQRSRGYFNNGQKDGIWITEKLKPNQSNGHYAENYWPEERITFKDGNISGPVVRYAMGRPVFEGTMDGKSFVGPVKFLDPNTGNVIAEGPYEQAKARYEGLKAKAEEQQLNEAEKSRAQAIKEHQARVAVLKKDWVEQKKENVSGYFSKSQNMFWTENLGMAKWLTAFQKCRNLGMRLPSDGEFKNAIAKGLNEIASGAEYSYWTGVDRRTENDPQKSLILGEHDAWAISGAGQIYPASQIREELFVRCVHK